MRRITLTVFFMALFLFSEANSENAVFGTFKIPLMVESKDRGFFIRLNNEIKKRTGLNIIIEVYPPKRALNYFRQKKIDVLFPAVDFFSSRTVR